MSENQKPQIKLEVDSTEARKGFNEIKDAARDMATSVEQAGKKAGAGVDSIGAGAPKAAEKVDRAAQSLIGSIQRTSAAMQAGERGTAKYFEALANQRGVNTDTLKPYLDQLRQAEAAQKAATGSLGSMEISAKQTAAALRGVPAQFTDIVTSLQGGQQPLTVFLQQGGQLKDMFGGAGAAARALGGYVVGLINPFTVAAVAAVGLGVAYAKGAAEAQEFNKTLILTGNQAGVTAGQLMDMAAAVRATGAGTQGRAAEIINLMASDSKIGAENMQRFTAAILQMERAGGPAAEELVKQFASLAKSPLESALKLNETTGFLTKSVYEQIRALEQAGKTTEAAKVAQEAYAKAIEERSPELVKNLGLIERAWLGIKDAAKGAADGALDIGRATPIEQQIQELRTRIGARSQIGNALSFVGLTNFVGPNKSDLDDLAALEAQVAAAKKLADEKARGKRETDASAEADKILVQLGIKQVTLAQELARVRTALTNAGKDEATINKALDKVREGFADKSAIAEANRELEGQKKLFAELAGLSGDFEKEWGLLNKAYKEGRISIENLEKAQKQLLDKQPFAKDIAKEQADAVKAQAKAREELTKAYEKEVDQLEKSATQAKDQVQRMQDEEKAAMLAASGQLSLAQAIQQVVIARLAEQQSAALKAGDQEKADAIKAEIEARRELITLIGKKDVRDAIAKDAKDAENEWLRASRQIEQSLTDALMRGFESGKGFAENLRDTISNMFRTLVLRPVVQAVVQPLAGAITGGLGLASSAANAGSLYGASSGLYGLMAGNSFIGNSTSVAAGIYGGMGELSSLGLGEALSSGWGALMGGQVSGGLATLTGALGPLVAGVAAIAAIAKSLDHSGTMHIGGSAEFSATGGLKTALPTGLYGVGVGNDPGTYSKQTEALATQLTQSIVGILDTTATAFGKQAGFSAAAAFADDSSKDGAWGALAIRLGDQMVGGFGADGNGRWPGKGFADGQAGSDQYLAAVSADVRKALDGIGLPSWATSMLDKLGSAPSLDQLSQTVSQINEIQAALGAMGKAMPQVANLTDTAVQALITAFGGIQGLGQSLGTYYENFYSEAERNAKATDQVTKALAGLGLTMPATREAFRALVEAQDLTTEAGQAAYAQLLKLAPTFASLVPVTQAVGQAVDDTAAAMQKAAEAMVEAGRRSLSGLADDKGGLLVDLLKAQGNASGAAALARQQALAKLTEGVSDVDKAAILAAYDYNQALREQIAALQAASTAAEQAAATQRQAEADAKAKAEAIASEAYGLTTQILQLEGNITELRRRELEQLDPANRALQERIYALQDQKAAESAAAQAADAIARAQASAASEAQRAAEEQARAAEQIREAWQSVTDSIFDEVKRIRGLISGGSSQSFANAQAQFAITSAQARAGDQEAAKLLPGLSQTLLTLAEAQATSLFELQRIRAQTAASLEGTAGALSGLFGLAIPKLATGTNHVDQDMLAILHRGEAVVPAAYNPAAGGGQGMDQLLDKVDKLQAVIERQGETILKLQGRQTQIVERWELNGMPETRA